MNYRTYHTRVLPLALLLCTLSACTYLIPDDPSVPRYNQVIGDRHKPQKNGDGSGPQSSAAESVPPAAMQTASATPYTPVTVNNLPPLPPVDASTQAKAEQEIAMASPPPAAPAPVASGRRVPVENIAMETDDGSAPPAISSVPPRPPLSGPDAVKTRLNADRRDLEDERTSAGFAKTQLSKDAAAEPSIQPPVDNSTSRIVPPPAPVMETPLPAPQGAITPPPAPALSNASNPAFLPPPPMMASLPPSNIAYTPAPIQLTPPSDAYAPIKLTPPGSFQPTTQTAQLTYPVSPVSYPAANGGFDPMATAPAPVAPSITSSAYSSGTFLPDSRYAGRH